MVMRERGQNQAARDTLHGAVTLVGNPTPLLERLVDWSTEDSEFKVAEDLALRLRKSAASSDWLMNSG